MNEVLTPATAVKPAASSFYKGSNGWKATFTQRLEWKSKNGKPLELDITTRKGPRGGLVTNASVAEVDGIFRTFAVFQDYSRRLAYTDSRCTEGNVKKQQEQAIKDWLTDVIAETRAQYAPETFPKAGQ